jgi:hypothetical protein
MPHPLAASGSDGGDPATRPDPPDATTRRPPRDATDQPSDPVAVTTAPPSARAACAPSTDGVVPKRERTLVWSAA